MKKENKIVEMPKKEEFIMPNFQFQNHKNCCFDVGNYSNDEKAISISIVDLDTGEPITSATSYLETDYEVGQAVIKNYSAFGNDVKSDVGMTEFLKNLGIVIDVIESTYVEDDERKTVDICSISLLLLQGYSKNWDYSAWEIEY